VATHKSSPTCAGALCSDAPNDNIRAYSDSISSVLGGKSFNQLVKKGDFLRVLSNARVVQLFSHGEGEKGLVFSDGNLLPEEVRGLKIDADLVSLAACESSNGKLIKGEGVKGMTEALINAGAKRVISSNWKIDEKTTSRILLDFYRNLSVGMRADSSLRLAKIKYLNEAVIGENTPSFWGGIVLYGNPEAIAIYKRTFPFVSPFVVACCTLILFILLLSLHYQFRIGLMRMLKGFQHFF
jgi:CHAT domain-containing protein